MQETNVAKFVREACEIKSVRMKREAATGLTLIQFIGHCERKGFKVDYKKFSANELQSIIPQA